MLLQCLIFLFVYSLTALAAGLETTIDPAVWPRQRQPTQEVPGGLHNPYRIPNTPLALNFNTTGPGLDRVDMVRTFSHFRRLAQKHIKENGDTPIPPRVSLGVQSVGLELIRRPNQMGSYPLTWGLAMKVVKAVNLKMHTEGFKARTGIVHIAGAEKVVVGFVGMGPTDPSRP
ncbi:hypothetical protein XPA_008122 [Xanthoria parietina]